MADNSLQISAEATTAARERRWFHWTLTFLSGFGFWICLWLLFAFHRSAVFWVQQVAMPGLLVALVMAFAYRQERRWHQPARRLRHLLDEVRAGRVTIDALDEVNGGLGGIRQITQEILRDLRQQKVVIAELNAEIQARIANRTDALERTIGSLRAQATRDALTSLYNRRMFDEYFPKVIEKCREQGEDIAILMIDVDNFKPLNDTLGHAAGDEMLRDIGKLIRSTIRDQDAAFRYGGDEFVVILPRCFEDGAQKMADRLVSLVDQLAKTLKVQPAPRLSIGIAVSRDHAATAESMLKDADSELYEVKRHSKASLGIASRSLRAAG